MSVVLSKIRKVRKYLGFVLIFQVDSIILYMSKKTATYVEKALIRLWIMWINMGMNKKRKNISEWAVDNLYLSTENCE